MKRTRKSLFISTILMVVLLIVAISTATFAWYSAQNTATAQNASLTTASTSAANIALRIDEESGWRSTVYLDAATDIRPMTPETLPAKNSEVEVENANLAFWEGTLKLDGGSSVFSDDPEPVGVTSWKAPTGFAVKNQDTSTARYVPITINVENVNIYEDGELLTGDDPRVAGMRKMLRIAIFASNALDAATGEEKLLFLGVYANGGTAYQGIPVPGKGENDWGNDNNGLTAIADPVTEFKFNLKGNTISNLTTYAWLDGTMLDAQYQNLKITFNLKFSAGGQVPVPVPDVPEE